jgi:hypothetical protein
MVCSTALTSRPFGATSAGPNHEEIRMATNDRNFDCQQCGAHFDSKNALDKHNQQQHARQAQSGSSSNVSSRPSSSSSSNINNRGMSSSDRDLNS